MFALFGGVHTDAAALAARVALGAMYLSHALEKIFIFTVPGTVGFFGQHGLPGSLAYLVIAVELVAAALLLAGMWSRWAALAGIPILIGAIVFVHGANGRSFAAPGGGWEYPVFLILASVIVALLGDGRYALSARQNRATAMTAQGSL